MNGQEPGFVEHMALLAATLSNTIKRITSYELFNYSTVKVREEISLAYGFDEPPEKTAILELPGVQLSIWGNPITNVAQKLGYAVERYEESFEKRVTARDLPVGWAPSRPAPSPPSVSEPCDRGWQRGDCPRARKPHVRRHRTRMGSADTHGCMRIRIEGDPNVLIGARLGIPPNRKS